MIIGFLLTLLLMGCGDSSKKYEKLYTDKADIGEKNYSLFYLDNDDIPELAVFGEGTVHNDFVDIYTIDKNNVVQLGSFGQYGTVAYIERSGIIVSEYESNGIMHTIIYEMDAGDVNEVENLSMNYNDDKITYYINDVLTDEDGYSAITDKYYQNLSNIGAANK